MRMVPAARPQITEEMARKILASAGVSDPVAVIGVRGYFEDTMGKPGRNDRGIYDDAVVVVWPEGIEAYNANTDPSIYRPAIATLLPGVHYYRKGNHGISRPGGGYPAFRPATPGEKLPVRRDGRGVSVGIAINIHKGSVSSTSSEGCQTIHPHQWSAFYSRLSSLLERYGRSKFPYVLIEEQGQ